jgi:uncharacterized protein (TIGR02145 family)
MKHILTFAALVFATACFGQSYDLIVEQSFPVLQPGTVYRIYIEANDPTDKISAFFGNDQQPLVFSTPEGIFNHPQNDGPCAPNPTSLLSAFFPDLADDSYICPWGEGWTITEDFFFPTIPTLAEYFTTSGWTGYSGGASWYQLNTASNALPVDGRWFVAQVTTTGCFSGVINAQIFPLGVGADQLLETWTFECGQVDDPCLEWYDECGVCGGSGIPEGACDCDGNVLDVCGDCGGTGYFACTDSGACNYDAGACGDDGSCEFVSCGGCMDPVACNYDPTMLLDDGSCDYCFCGPGTEYDTESGQCLIVVEDAGYCGPGTYWVEALNKCFISTPGDTDFDGCVGVADLLGLLSIFGNCEGQEVAAWSCGDELEHQGDLYTTVQIGEQCWFGENLQNAAFRNGDPLSPSTTWAYGADDGECFSLSPDGDACDEGWSYSEFGRLYSWVAVNDDRGLCPTGWHVPSDAEWIGLEITLGMDAAEATGTGFRGTDQGAQLKSTYGYDEGGNGSNSSGFSGLPGGFRTTTPVYNSAGYYGNWWTSSPGGAGAFLRFICYDTDQISRGTQDQGFGLSIRCIQDSE